MELGRTLNGRYTLLRLIGEGGMGAVYEARHTGTGRRVAVKQITGDIAKNNTLRARFEVEAFCYVDGGASIGDPELSQDCLVKGADGDFEPGRQLRLLGAAVAKEDGALYLACRSGAAACSAK